MKRAYHSALREEQRQVTRERILEALVEELAAGAEEFALRKVADRAGVSLRTVYQHFPNREDQIEAVAAYIDEQTGPDALPIAADQLAAYCRRRYDAFAANERVFRAQLNAGIAAEVRKKRRSRRELAIDAALTATGAPADRTKLAGALIKHLIGAPAGLALMDQYGLSFAEATAAAEWAVALLVRALTRAQR